MCVGREKSVHYVHHVVNHVNGDHTTRCNDCPDTEDLAGNILSSFVYAGTNLRRVKSGSLIFGPFSSRPIATLVCEWQVHFV